ncbi:class D sortase [Bacillus sp. RO2]|uniref:class D sortase n=1 Tax=Bacillus sp. RO2 TaxID=2723913 RepID=UPI00145E508A|nr:class D sortase [Bacillus sp. RO2]NMH71494.1 class D sortase [Bacillus sp. RO2]
MRERYLVVVLWMVMVTGAALFVGSGLLYWQGVAAVEDRAVLEQETVEELTLRERKDYTELKTAAITIGEEIGEVNFPALEISIPVFHGVSEEELVKGVGHVPGTLLPGGGGNILLSGHRDTVFRRLRELEVGDKVLVRFDGSLYTYKIGTIRVVDKDDTSVVVPRPREVLTITTCYPFTFIGRAPKRYVLEAEFIGRVDEAVVGEKAPSR